MHFVSQGQFTVFLTCFSFGLLLGALKGLFIVPKTSVFVLRGWQATLDFLFFAAALPAFLFLSFSCRFPTFRPYMAAGVFGGFLVMRKILHHLVAKPLAKWYNQRKESLQSPKNAQKSRFGANDKEDFL